jgi:predicted transcriptional regulator
MKYSEKTAKARTGCEEKQMKRNLADELKEGYTALESSRQDKTTLRQRAAEAPWLYEEWRLKQIDEGLAELKSGKGIPDAEFWARIGTVKNIGKRAA